ncbi:hypothetical protein ABZ348_22665 [Streptomyces sp. NPDC005963]|uniref:hypothetical protein n=1 Tax=Streptomyces sp. NPDC005963 TaxID=3156721 RepID=UPI0033D829BD
MDRSLVVTMAAMTALTGGMALAAVQTDGSTDPAKTRTTDGTAAPLRVSTPPLRLFGDAVVLEPGQSGSAHVSCPTGQVPSGGGVSNGNTFVHLTDGFATGPLWVARAKNTDRAAPHPLRAFVICTTARR